MLVRASRLSRSTVRSFSVAVPSGDVKNSYHGKHLMSEEFAQKYNVDKDAWKQWDETQNYDSSFWHKVHKLIPPLHSPPSDKNDYVAYHEGLEMDKDSADKCKKPLNKFVWRPITDRLGMDIYNDVNDRWMYFLAQGVGIYFVAMTALDLVNSFFVHGHGVA
ncbi:MAG: hypothetical protein MHM6MM_003405 [Cercozoa sp. M6MM]